MSQILTSSYSALAIDVAVNVLLKGTLIVGAAGLATYFLRDTSAAVRHAVWSVALLALLLLPVMEALLPAWKMEPLFVTVSSQTESLQTAIVEGGSVGACECTCDCGDCGGDCTAAAGSFAGRNGDTGAIGAYGGSGADVGRRADGEGTAAYLLFLWLLGASMLLGRFAIDALRVNAMTHRAARASDGDRALARSLAADLGIRRCLRLLVSDELSVPITFGVLIPVVVLPSSADTWSAERKRVVLLHELAHVRRWDYAIHVMIVVACAFYWFNPVVWLAARLSSVEQERACDDQALVGGVRSDIYATHLVEIARSLVEPAPNGAFAMAHPSSLATRVKSILARGLNRASISKQQLMHLTVGAIAVAFPLSSVDLWGVLQEEMLGGAVEARVQQLQDGDAKMRRYAAWALGELESSRGVDPLIGALDDRNADVRLVSAWALGEIKSSDAVDPLIEALDDRDPFVREMAVLSLGEIGSTRAIDPIMDAVGNDEALREPAFWALDQIGGEPAHDARHDLFEHRGELGWESAEVWFGYLDTREARSIGANVPALIDALNDRDASLRASAAEYLGDSSDPLAVDALLNTLRDPDPRVRAMAIWALDEINPSSPYSSR